MYTDIIIFLTVLVTIIGTLGAAIITGHYTRKSNLDVIKQKYKLKQENQDIKRTNKVLELYTKIIKLDYDKNIVEYNHHNRRMYFESKTYFEPIRPIIYENYHIIDDDIVYYFNLMEDINKEINIYNHFDDIIEMNLCNNYLLMIEKIKKKSNCYRSRLND